MELKRNEIAVHPAALSEKHLLAQCRVRRQRRSGPGGQHRNKVETAVIVLHEPTGVKAEATERRSQEENRRAAMFRLRVHLALDVRVPAGRETTPSELWQSRCRGGRIQINPKHADFPIMLAEALDVLASLDMNPKAAAAALECSFSQLVKFLKIEPRALRQVNDRLREQGRGPLR